MWQRGVASQWCNWCGGPLTARPLVRLVAPTPTQAVLPLTEHTTDCQAAALAVPEGEDDDA